MGHSDDGGGGAQVRALRRRGGAQDSAAVGGRRGAGCVRELRAAGDAQHAAPHGLGRAEQAPRGGEAAGGRREGPGRAGAQQLRPRLRHGGLPWWDFCAGAHGVSWVIRATAVAMLLEHSSASEERLAEGTGMGKDAIKEEVEEDGDEADANSPKVLQETVLEFDFAPGLPTLRARELALEWSKDAFGSTAEEDITGVSIWSAALILSRWVIDHRDVFDGKQVCELGSGCGVSGLAVHKYTNAARVVLSDLFAHTIQNLEHNLELNKKSAEKKAGADAEEKQEAPVLDCCGRCGAVQRFTPDNPEGKLMTCGGCRSVAYCSRECQKKAWKKHKADCKAIRAQREQAESLKESKLNEEGIVQVEAIDWAQRETWPITCDGDKFDVLFGSDLVYHQEIVPVLVNVVDGMLAADGRFVHVASQARHSLVEFKEAMESRGFSCTVEEVPEDYKTNPLVGNDAVAELFALHFNEMSDVYCIYTFTRTSQP
ncbi:hypothetical protein ON010_g12852 [Phytophthora cinnamomi]|nr:hypothetical protein ON010_g12852 [Phytophthora cinnamomi]